MNQDGLPYEGGERKRSPGRHGRVGTHAEYRDGTDEVAPQTSPASTVVDTGTGVSVPRQVTVPPAGWGRWHDDVDSAVDSYADSWDWSPPGIGRPARSTASVAAGRDVRDAPPMRGSSTRVPLPGGAGRRRRDDPGAARALWLAVAGLLSLPIGIGVILAACSVVAGCRAENRIAATGRRLGGNRRIEIASILNHITLGAGVFALSVALVLALL